MLLVPLNQGQLESGIVHIHQITRHFAPESLVVLFSHITFTYRQLYGNMCLDQRKHTARKGFTDKEAKYDARNNVRKSQRRG